MKTEIVRKLNADFETVARAEQGVEYWHARDLQGLLGYSRWENFAKVIKKAITACENSRQRAGDHFRDITKMVIIGSAGRYQEGPTKAPDRKEEAARGRKPTGQTAGWRIVNGKEGRRRD